MDYDIEPMGLAVVTGATSGVGLEIARALGARGFDLLLVADDPGIEFVARSLRAGGSDADGVQVDLATSRGVEEVYARVVERGEQVEVLVLNSDAGAAGPFLLSSLEAEIAMIRRNCVAAVHLAKRLLPVMVSAGSGYVLMASSNDADQAGPRDAVSDATSAFRRSFSRGIRDELRRTGVTVGWMQPGDSDPIVAAGEAVDAMIVTRNTFVSEWARIPQVAISPRPASPSI
jgi:short-subunit dehydrogenase